MNHQIFISYSSKDKITADAICHVLESNGIKCWIAPRDIPAGSEYGDLIDQAIKQAKSVVVIFSAAASSSNWVKAELNVAFEEQKAIVPFRIDATPFIGQHRLILNHKHWIDAYPDYKTKFNDLVISVQNTLGIVPGPGHGIPPEERRDSTIWGKKFNFKYIVATCCIITATLGAYWLMNKPGTYSYKREFIEVSNTSDLSNEQQTALDEILDNMVYIPEGEFVMGNDYSNSENLTKLDSISSNPHKVILSPFYISRYELTQKQWKAFKSLAGNYIELGDNKAIDNISWEEAKSFTDILSSLTGLDISLPTEAQWEYAAGDAKQNNRHIFAGFSDGIHHYSWNLTDSLSSAAEVGKKSPNQLGLFDLTGNVSEWCLDDYQPYCVSTVKDPLTTTDGMKKIFRGGDYLTPNIMDMKITTRYFAPAFAKREATGLRLVINIKTSDTK